jgi:hypothetical protein
VFGEFGILELCRLNLFKFRIKVLKTKRKLNLPPPSWTIDPYSGSIAEETNLTEATRPNTTDDKLHALKQCRWAKGLYNMP